VAKRHPRLEGDYAGTTWEDWLILPGALDNDKKFTPEDVDISVKLKDVNLLEPFLTAAMVSVTGRDLTLAASKHGMMPVIPRGLSIEEAVEILNYVNKNTVRPGEIEKEDNPLAVSDKSTLGFAVRESKRTGYSNIPVVTRKMDLVGMFRYNPLIHDRMDYSTLIVDVMKPYRPDECNSLVVCHNNMSDDEIKGFLRHRDLRFVTVVDDVGRLDKLVFLQKTDAYRVGAAIDTHDGWQKRAEKLIEAGAQMIFIDTSDAHKPFSREVVEKHAEIVKKYKDVCKDYPPLCAGNIVTGAAFEYLAKAGTDLAKTGMGSGSICTTNEVLRVGRAPFAALVDVVEARDAYYKKTGRYVPIIADGGIRGTGDINVALTFADAVMGGNIFGCFYESQGDILGKDGRIYPKDGTSEGNIRAKKIYGEASQEAFEARGELKRYTTPTSQQGVITLQGVSGWTDYRGRFKPGVENYARALREAMYHVGAETPGQYRKKALLERLSERAKETTKPHGIEVIA
jgi:IMP dehydrogenase